MTNTWQCYLLKFKNKNCQNIKRLPHSFSYFEGQMHIYPSVHLYFYAKVLLKQYLMLMFNVNLCTLIAKYTIILNFNFSHTIYPFFAQNFFLSWIYMPDCFLYVPANLHKG